MSSALIIFVRHPEEGKVKTRLAATMGTAAALSIYKKLLHHTRQITIDVPAAKFVYYADSIPNADDWSVAKFTRALQPTGDLGFKMQRSFVEIFELGFEKICIIGSDCAELTTQIINDAFEKLNTHDVVIGPAFDGGYYLLGLSSLQPDFFQQKKWSSSSVFDDTVNDVKRLGLSLHVLPQLNDVDEEKDVPAEWLQQL